MKKILLAALVVCSFSAISAPYIGVEYGFGTTNHDVETKFKEGADIKLDPELEDGIFSGYIGYSINQTWAIEFGYSQFDLDDSHSKNLGIVTQGGKDYFHEKDWDASIKVKQFIVAPVFTYALNEKWLTKFKLGLTYTRYKIHSSLDDEFEWVLNDDVEKNQRLESYSDSSNEVGGLFSAGAEYQILPQLTLGANVKYQFDSFADTASVNVGTTYYF